MTPEGIMLLCVLAICALCTLLWIFEKAHSNSGVAELPSALMFGWGGAAWGRTCIVIDRNAWHKEPLIAHEQCHQGQMKRDGTLTFYWRYFTSADARFAYELEAYRVWVRVAPGDLHQCAWWLVNDYGLDVTIPEALKLLTEA